MTRFWPLLVSLLLGLAACQTPPPPPPRPVHRAPPRPAPAPVPAEVEGDWSFSILGDRCSARVAHREMALGITAGPGRQASLSLTAPGRALPAGGPLRIGFRGEGGTWQLPGRTDRRRAASATLPLDATGQGRIQDLLGGGTVTASGRGVSAPALSVPDAGVSGRDWYACVDRLTRE